ncbi:hypothetical protein GF352_00235 [archaeon]|nr:hypothetical protein [archaeon]
MPFYDGTGPRGMGPMTGRGLGPCGRGLGFRRGYAYRPSRTSEKELLKEDKKLLEKELEEINKRLKELEE